jgi:hypothetical protein
MDSIIKKRKIIREKYINEITKQGILEGERKMLKELIEMKFNQLTREQIKLIEKANTENLKNISSLFLNALTLEEVFKID